MKIWELASGINIIMSEEEHALVERFLEEKTPSLNEREHMVAQYLTQKDILIKEEKDDVDDIPQDCCYSMNWRVDVWRD